MRQWHPQVFPHCLLGGESSALACESSVPCLEEEASQRSPVLVPIMVLHKPRRHQSMKEKRNGGCQGRWPLISSLSTSHAFAYREDPTFTPCEVQVLLMALIGELSKRSSQGATPSFVAGVRKQGCCSSPALATSEAGQRSCHYPAAGLP